MIRGAAVGLSLVAVGMAGMIGLELIDHDTRPSGLFDRPAQPVAARIPGRVGVSRGDIGSRLSDVLARPMFSPSRRPAGTEARSVAGLSRLTGIVVIGSRKIAIFAAPSGGAPIVAEEGSRINAYEVAAITETSVTVNGPSGAMVMTPLFDPAPAAVPATRAAPAPQRPNR